MTSMKKIPAQPAENAIKAPTFPRRIDGVRLGHVQVRFPTKVFDGTLQPLKIADHKDLEIYDNGRFVEFHYHCPTTLRTYKREVPFFHIDYLIPPGGDAEGDA